MKKYQVEKNDKFGRYLVAASDLESGELIFEENPFVIGPKPDSPVLCLGCYGACVDSTGTVRGCSKCSWPVCSAECEATPNHQLECQVFSEARVKFQQVEDPLTGCVQLDCITPLRMLKERERQADRWSSEVETLEPHTEARKDCPAWNADQNNVAQFLVKHCKMADKYNEELAQKVCGILQVNSVEIPSRGEEAAVRAIYPQLALAAHNCVPNIVHTVTPDQRVEVRAAIPLKAGAPLFLCYGHPLTPTLLRREYLRASKYFDCACDRCVDPTELGTHLSSLKCSKCDDGLILSTDPLESNAGWKCTHCEFKTSGDAVRKILCVVQSEVDQLDAMEPSATAIEMREQFLKKYRSAFHPQHALLLGVKLSLGQLYGRVEGYELDELPDILLERKLEQCKLLLRVLDKLIPGETRLRATVIYEMHAPLMYLARTQMEMGLIDNEQLKSKLQEPLQCLLEAARVLQREDPRGAEGALGNIAASAAKQLQDSIDSL